MDEVIVLVLLVIGVLAGLTTVLFGFGGGFATVPVVLWADAAAGAAAGTVAVATSAIVMVVNAAVATAATPRAVLARLRHRAALLVLLAAGGLVGAVAALFAPAALASWGFVVYLAATILDVLARPGFLRPLGATADDPGGLGISAVLGAPIGALASLLGVGGSVMTVPLLRRSGLSMGHATALANPLTLAISLPAAVVFLVARAGTGVSASLLPVGTVDVGAAALLLAGGIPVIVLLRRRPPRISDRVHAGSYLALLVVVLGAVLASLLWPSVLP